MYAYVHIYACVCIHNNTQGEVSDRLRYILLILQIYIVPWVIFKLNSSICTWTVFKKYPRGQHYLIWDDFVQQHVILIYIEGELVRSRL